MARTLARVALELLEAGVAEGQPHPTPLQLHQLCRALAQGPDEAAPHCTRPTARVRVHALLLLLSELAARGGDFATAVALGSGAQWAYHALCEYRAAPVHAAALRLLRLLDVDPAGRASIHGVGGGGGGDAGAQQADTAHVLAHCVARATGSLPSMQLHTTRVHQQWRQRCTRWADAAAAHDAHAVVHVSVAAAHCAGDADAAAEAATALGARPSLLAATRAHVTRVVHATCRAAAATAASTAASMPPVSSSPSARRCACEPVPGMAAAPVPLDDARRALHGQQRLVATRRWSAYQLVAPYRAWVADADEWEECVPLAARSELQRYTVASATRVTDDGHEHAPATELLFCAHPAGFSNATCRINDCGVVVPPPLSCGAKRARTAAAVTAAASASTATSAEGNCVLMEVVALGWPFLFVVTTRSVAIGEELVLEYGGDVWRRLRRLDEVHEAMMCVLGGRVDGR